MGVGGEFVEGHNGLTENRLMPPYNVAKNDDATLDIFLVF